MSLPVAKLVSDWTPDLLDSLDPEQRRMAEELLENRFGCQALDEFIIDEFPFEPPPPHLQPIIDLIERAQHERIKVCISMPPRHGKTVTILRGLVWWMMNNPADTCAYYSYSDTQAKKKSRVCRNWARQAGMKMDPEADNMGEWRNSTGGGLLAGGLQSGLTGMGVSGLFVVDDPFKNRAEANSPVIREKVWDNFNEVVFTRLEGASVIVCHTRWHEDDLIGRLVTQDNAWEYINLPAIAANDNDILGREEGEALWPEKYPIAELEAILDQIRARAFAALYQGGPTPADGNIIKREWIRYYDELPKGLTGHLQSWDLTNKGKEQRKNQEKGSYVVGQIWARKGADFYLIDQYRGRPNMAGTLAAIRSMSAKHPEALLKLIEDAATGAATQSLLKDEIPGIVLVGTKGQSKEDRLDVVSPMLEAGNVWLPRWCEELVEELVAFPNAANDDQVDTLSMALNRYRTDTMDDIELDMNFGLKSERWGY